MFIKDDIVKWISGVTTAETADVMVVVESDGRFVQVRHINESGSPVSMAIAADLRKVGTAGGMTTAELIRKFKNI